ncbi:hypothetical protein HNQ77_004812 [Silvibacterium bohemicum]|uniref:Uncharacterized protein n=1 Tax=Silvibacterium bohemicum TaxID=1577686 RepID=A0A841K6R9_9BACT|nr:hypothetical protein [Silvibacterium bohemicum]MBB6146831.1 hypothetical protein [Silvibacterium bohemicum]
MEPFPDGLTELRRVLSLREIMALIEKTARWVSPETFKLLPIWFPEHARRGLFYKGKWSEPQMNTSRATGQSVHKTEGNIHANKALTLALGLRKNLRKNWSCCHIWGVDDASYQLSNLVIQDHAFFSCVGNMVLLPTPLKAFTDTMPEVKALLRICAFNLYGWQCDHEHLSATNEALSKWTDWEAYPESWPMKQGEGVPLGVVELNATIRTSADKRLAAIRHDLEHAGEFYPREKVLAALEYWKVEL